jgi:uncharacterized membrane protein affecting hemolysin expression
MRLSRRLMLSLFCGVAAVSTLFAIYQAEAEKHALTEQVQRQALVLVESQSKPVAQMLLNGSRVELQTLADQFQMHARLAGMAVYDAQGKPVAITSGPASHLAATPAAVTRALQSERSGEEFFRSGGEPMHILVMPLAAGGRMLGAIGIIHDLAFIGTLVWRHALISVVQTLLIVAITLLIVSWSLGRPLHSMAQWLRDLRTGAASAGGKPPEDGIFLPLSNEVARLATSLHAARAAAEQEARLRDEASSQWTSERLRISIQGKLNGSRIFASRTVRTQAPGEFRCLVGSSQRPGYSA